MRLGPREALRSFGHAGGGGITYHGPGQLMLYPVISLRERRLGVRRFVERGLQAITVVFRSFGVDAVYELKCRAGVWVGGRKLASVGLRIIDGVTLHGWSINIACDLRPFSLFSPCGIKNCPVSSLENEAGLRGNVFDEFTIQLIKQIDSLFFI